MGAPHDVQQVMFRCCMHMSVHTHPLTTSQPPTHPSCRSITPTLPSWTATTSPSPPPRTHCCSAPRHQAPPRQSEWTPAQLFFCDQSFDRCNSRPFWPTLRLITGRILRRQKRSSNRFGRSPDGFRATISAARLFRARPTDRILISFDLEGFRKRDTCTR